MLLRREALVVRVLCAWTVFIWVTRIWNIWGDDHPMGFKVVHTALALVSVLLAAVTWRVLTRARRRSRGRDEAAEVVR